MQLSQQIARVERLPRVGRDIKSLLSFIRKQPRGNPSARYFELLTAIYTIAENPILRPVDFKRRSNGLELRRWNIKQFAIIYSYHPRTVNEPAGVVRIRAVRHTRVRNVFSYVRETPRHPYGIG